MKRRHFIGIDVHCQFCEMAVVDAVGNVMYRDRCATTIPALLAVLEKLPRSRSLVIEEGPLAGWLWRSLAGAVERMVVSEPRRNRLIAQDGDKDDDLDAEKLARVPCGPALPSPGLQRSMAPPLPTIELSCRRRRWRGFGRPEQTPRTIPALAA